MSDGNAPGAAKISLPINSREVIYFNACGPGSNVGSQGLRRAGGAQRLMDGASCSTEQYTRLVGLALLGMKSIIL